LSLGFLPIFRSTHLYPLLPINPENVSPSVSDNCLCATHLKASLGFSLQIPFPPPDFVPPKGCFNPWMLHPLTPQLPRDSPVLFSPARLSRSFPFFWHLFRNFRLHPTSFYADSAQFAGPRFSDPSKDFLPAVNNFFYASSRAWFFPLRSGAPYV